jgi:hypothetical protein
MVEAVRVFSYFRCFPVDVGMVGADVGCGSCFVQVNAVLIAVECSVYR